MLRLKKWKRGLWFSLLNDFKTYCSTIYCLALWFNSTKTALTKLKIVYNNSLRRLLGRVLANNWSWCSSTDYYDKIYHIYVFTKLLCIKISRHNRCMLLYCSLNGIDNQKINGFGNFTKSLLLRILFIYRKNSTKKDHENKIIRDFLF